VGEALQGASEALAAAGVDSPRLDAQLLLGSATGLERAELAAKPETELPAGAAREYAAMVRRRLRREPVAYILGSKGFRGVEVAVDRRVLIPRPESELLVEVALELSPRRVLDVGTGSGAVALAIADELEGCEVTATDTSPGALEVARANARQLGLEDRVRFVAGSVPEGESFELAVANLPYVAAGERDSLAPEISRWEPPEALLAGDDGLAAFREVLPRLEGVSVIALEVGAGQAAEVAALVGQHGFSFRGARSDLAGIERVVVAGR
jgi:release factor glutamine methyltransferase